MLSRNKLKKIVVATSIALFGMSSVANAGMGAKMNSMFNSLSNATSPGAFQTSARGVVSGGSLVIRNQISSVSLFNVQAPSIENGCGGIDFFGGSFSFISADQLVEFLKNVASNALGYAFKMALKATCESCLNILNDLQNLANAMNNMNFNSCQIAQGIVTDISDHFQGKKMQNLTDLLASAKGVVEDIGSAFNKTGGQSGSQAVKADTTNTVQKIVNTNFVYAAIRDSGTHAMFSDGSSTEETQEFLMSLTGTVIQKVPGEDDPPTAVPFVNSQPPLLSFKDFIDGTYSGDVSDARTVTVYTCSKKDSKCLTLGKNNAAKFKGLRTLLVEKLTTPGETTNLAEVFRNQTKDLTNEQMNIANVVGPNVTKFIRDLAMIDEGLAVQFIIETAPIIAGQVAYENGERIFKEVSQSFRAMDKTLDSGPAKKMMKESHAAFRQGFIEHVQTYGGLDKLLTIHKILMESAQSPRPFTNKQNLGKK